MMRTRILQMVGLLSALSIASFSTDAAIAQQFQPPQSPEPTATTADDRLDRIASPKAEKQLDQTKPDGIKAIGKAAKNSHSESTQMTQKVRAALEKFGNIEYIEVPFVDVKQELEAELGFNIVLDQSAVDDMLTEEELVTIRLRKVRYSDGLRLMLRAFNATYTVQNGIVRIISLDNVNDPEQHSLAMLNVQPTLDLIRQFDARTNRSQQKEQEVSALNTPAYILSKTIMSIVQDDAWLETGRGEAALEITGGILILRGPENLISEVKDFVQDLHAELEAKTN